MKNRWFFRNRYTGAGAMGYASYEEAVEAAKSCIYFNGHGIIQIGYILDDEMIIENEIDLAPKEDVDVLYEKRA